MKSKAIVINLQFRDMDQAAKLFEKFPKQHQTTLFVKHTQAHWFSSLLGITQLDGTLSKIAG